MRAVLYFLLALVLVLDVIVALAPDDGPAPAPRPAAVSTTTTPPPNTLPAVVTVTTTTTTRPAVTVPATVARNPQRTTAPTSAIASTIRREFARFGPAVAEQAVRVAGCESTGDPTGRRLNPAATNGEHVGLFQISRRWHAARVARMGITWDRMLDAATNARVAASIYAEQQWSPWTCRWAA